MRPKFRPALGSSLAWLAFFLIVAGVRLCFVSDFGSAMPILDQWDDEAGRIIKPYVEGDLGLAQIFAAHNEHRPVIARLLTLALFILNDQWDARLQMTANAGLAAGLAVAVAWIGTRLIGERDRLVVMVAVACWSCLPYGWENTISGFQSSFYFLLLFSVLAIWGLVGSPSRTRGWFVGLLAATLACFSMGSGFLAAGAILGIVTVRCRTRRVIDRDSLTTMAACAAIMALGIASNVHVPDHDVLRATSFWQWIDVFARCLAWPFSRYAAAALFINLPIAWLALSYLRHRASSMPAADARRAELVLAFALFVVLQAAAIAYTRGGGLADTIAPRYLDLLAFGTVANFFALFLAVRRAPLPSRSIAAAWVGVVGIGAGAVGYASVEGMRGRSDQVRNAETQVRAYLANGDIRELASDTARIAYPWAERFTTFLDDATIRRVLPAAVRLPLKLEPDGDSGGFVAQSGAAAQIIWNSEAAGIPSPGAEFRSHAIRPSLPYLRFELQGALGKGRSLKLLDEQTGRQTRVKFLAADDAWRTGYASVREDVRVIARDHDPEQSLAFTEPKEVGRLSYLTEQLLDRSVGVLLLGLGLASALAVHALLARAAPEASI